MIQGFRLRRIAPKPFFVAFFLLATLLISGLPQGFGSAPARAEEAASDDFGGGDDFGLTEADPELPAKIRKWNADCLSCHSEEGVKNPPRAGMDLKLLATLTQDAHRFEMGDHGKMACKDCHTEAYVPYPHLPKAKEKIKGCIECHQQPAKIIEPEFKASVHFKELGASFTCLSCHEAHIMKKASKIGSAHMATEQDNTQCLTCHGDDATYAKWKPKDKRPDMAVAHDWLPEQDLHFAQVRCMDCHTPVPELTLSHTVLPKEKAVRDCAACHSDDGELGKRLYKKMLRDSEDGWGGFRNAPWLGEIYVMGANRNQWLELSALALVSLTAVIILLRLLWRRLRRTPPSASTPPASNREDR